MLRVAVGRNVVSDPNSAWDIDINKARLQAALAEFDTNFLAEIYSGRYKQPPNSFFGPGLANPDSRDEAAFKTGFQKKNIYGGQGSLLYNPEPGYLYLAGEDSDSFNPRHVGELELQLRQPLLKGAGLAVNRAPILITQITVQQSVWEFKKAVMASLRSIASEYWNLQAERVALQSIEEVIPLLEEVVRLQELAYKAKWVIYADVAKARAQLYDFRERRLQLLSSMTAVELRLRNLLGIQPGDGFNLRPITPPSEIPPTIDAHESFDTALANNPDLVRLRLAVRIRELEVQVANNQKLPQLDLQALYRMNGVGADVGSALDQMLTAEYSDWLLGATFSVPLGQRAATSLARGAELQLRRESDLLHQNSLRVLYDLSDEIQRINYSYETYDQARLQLRESEEWVKGCVCVMKTRASMARIATGYCKT